MAIDREQLGTAPAAAAWWRDPRVRAIAYQVLTLLGVVLFFAYIVNNTIHNLDKQGIASGFDFLDKPAGFGIPQTLVDYDITSPNSRVFWVGLLNTILVAGIGIAPEECPPAVRGAAAVAHDTALAGAEGLRVRRPRRAQVGDAARGREGQRMQGPGVGWTPRSHDPAARDAVRARAVVAGRV